MQEKTFSNMDAWTAAMSSFTENSGYTMTIVFSAEGVNIVAAAVLAVNTLTAMQLIMQLDSSPPDTIVYLFIVYYLILRSTINLIVYKVLLLLNENKRVSVDDVLGFDVQYHLANLMRMLAASAVYSVYALIGTLFLIVPGIFVTATLRFYKFVIVDRDADAVQSLRESYELSAGNKADLIAFNIMSAAIKLLGLMLFGVGFIPARSLCILAETHAYRALDEARSMYGLGR